MVDGGPSSTRGDLMRILLRNKANGCTLDELGEELGITRNAVKQHITVLERDGLVTVVDSRSTGGRPSRAYGLTPSGLERFPRQYDVLALGMLETLHEAMGEDAVEAMLAKLADRLAEEHEPSLRGLPPQDRRRAVVTIMNEIGYAARLDDGAGGIRAVNCVYHKLASRTRAVCRFDERLLSRLAGERVTLGDCMAEGRNSCVFALSGEAEGPAG